MNAAEIITCVREAQNAFLGYVLTTIEAVLPSEAQFKAVRKLLLDKHGAVNRELEKSIIQCGYPEIIQRRASQGAHNKRGG